MVKIKKTNTILLRDLKVLIYAILLLSCILAVSSAYSDMITKSDAYSNASDDGEISNALTVSNTNININGFEFGIKSEINWNQLPNELKLGLTANTPFLGGWLALRGGVDVGFLRGIPATSQLSNSVWANYYDYRGGVVLTASRRTDVIRPYIESGFIYISPSSFFTSDVSAWGIYGLFGFDVIFPGDYSGYFFELGAIGLMKGGIADNYSGSPLYGTGLTLSLGWRFYL